MIIKCPKEKCAREWNYKGSKTYPAFISCPDCRTNIRLPEVKK